jgi:hypothetical protein
MLWAKETSGMGNTPSVSWWRRTWIPTPWSTRSVIDMDLWFLGSAHGVPTNKGCLRWTSMACLVPKVAKVEAFEAQCYWQLFRSVGFPSSRTSTHAVNRFQLATIFRQWPNRCQLHWNWNLTQYKKKKMHNPVHGDWWISDMNVHAWRPISQSGWNTTKMSAGCLWN